MRTRLALDVRYAARWLRRRPVLSGAAILTLALGMGGVTAVFSLLGALFLRDLPVDDPRRLARAVERRDDGTIADAFTLSTYDELQRGSAAFSGILASSRPLGGPGEIEVRGERRREYVQLVSANYFDVLGVGASLGRVFHQAARGKPVEPIAVISDALWRREYGGDPGVLGARLRYGVAEVTVAGVMPAGFRGTEIDVPADIWIPVDHVVAANSPSRASGRWMRVMGRLGPGATLAQAEAEVSAALGRRIQLEPGGSGYSALRQRLAQPLMLAAVLATLVLLIACANVANLMLAAAASREREVAVRAALGASSGRILRQFLAESVLLTSAGAALGLVVAHWTSAALLAFLPPADALAIPNLRFQLDARVATLVAGLAVGTCALFGGPPALWAGTHSAAGALRAGAGVGGRGRGVLGRGLLAGQVAMCTALLVVAAVFVRTVQNLRGQDAGYSESRLIVADVGFPRDYSEARRDDLIEQLRARAAALPGVEVAAFSHAGQLSGGAIEFRIGFPGRGRQRLEQDEAPVVEQRISPGFLRAMGTPLTTGREFVASDDDRAPLVAVVNEAFVRRFLPDRAPLGAKFFREGGSRSGELMEIVGVVKDSKWINLRDEPPVMYYRPYRQMGGTPSVRLAIRTFADPRPVSRAFVAAARSIDPGIVLGDVLPFREIVNRTLVVERLIAHASTALALLGLMIAGVGLYGVLAYGVARRRREIGIRIAVGAGAAGIERMILFEASTIVGAGAALGVPAGLALTRLMSSRLFGLSAHDPVSIALAVAVLATAGLAAAYLPARAAARVDPILALRQD